MFNIHKHYVTFGAFVTMSALMGTTSAHATGASSTSLTPVTTTTYTEGSGFSTIFDRITTSFEGLPGLISMFSYLIGIVFAIAGVLKIKDHVEDPNKTDLKSGAIRLVAGGALFALPYVMQVMTETIGSGGDIDAPKLGNANPYK
jgi:hypothetical protein